MLAQLLLQGFKSGCKVIGLLLLCLKKRAQRRNFLLQACVLLKNLSQIRRGSSALAARVTVGLSGALVLLGAAGAVLILRRGRPTS